MKSRNIKIKNELKYGKKKLRCKCSIVNIITLPNLIVFAATRNPQNANTLQGRERENKYTL